MERGSEEGVVKRLEGAGRVGEREGGSQIFELGSICHVR